MYPRERIPRVVIVKNATVVVDLMTKDPIAWAPGVPPWVFFLGGALCAGLLWILSELV